MKVSVVFFANALCVLMKYRLVVFITSAGRHLADISRRIARHHIRLPSVACPFGAFHRRQFPSVVDHHPCLVRFQSRFNLRQPRHGLYTHEAR